MSKTPEFNPDDHDRESDIMTIDGQPIANSTPEQIEEERERNEERDHGRH